ncbi:FliA/WhiG family RNA polymerase sigma factor [Clostridium sp. D2Q-14]|uniref:sigma-70 family RNA polymerase sigma factor n=1 Tax=Anaeromonas gelatinilytica TaxID=2683194 RepID=UPI00193B0020|nr:FliA/WhiG family RNA polymerase sigma factor [Anaeromonas gelatinilytica]MBS4536026.1 FliA/WhiG family RNA polymerase sigma factor [Anaeromonas gelatinilytica]
MVRDKLWKDYQVHDSIEIKNKLIEEYAHIIKIVASRMYNYYGGKVEFDELMGFGSLGLIDAIDKFDPYKGVKFETYAQLRIKGEIIDNIRKNDWVPRTLRTKAKLVERTMYDLENKLDREVHVEDISKELNMSVKEIEEVLKEINSFNVSSLDDIMFNRGEDPLDYLEDPQFIVESKEYIEIISDIILDLPKKEKDVITLYYYEELNYKEIGKIIQLSESRISQIHSKAIKNIRKQLNRININN